jgi:hypothetical protein
VAAPILGGGIGLFSLGGEATDARLAAIEGEAAERGRLRAIARRPLTDCGHGSFADVFCRVRNAEVPQDLLMAHNSELGVGVQAAALPVLAFVALYLCSLIAVRVRGRDAVCSYVEVGATVLVGAQGEGRLQAADPSRDGGLSSDPGRRYGAERLIRERSTVLK